jgi:hypothetical protein
LYAQAGNLDLTYVRHWLRQLFPGEDLPGGGASTQAIDEHIARFDYLVDLVRQTVNEEAR